MERWITAVTLLAASAGISARAAAQDGGNTRGASQSAIQGMVWTSSDSPLRDDGNRSTDEAELLANSREAGLLTDWHLEGCFGHGGEAEFARKFGPERLAQKQAKRVAAGVETELERRHYELVFPRGTFALPSELARRSGVFYASSSTYLDGSGEWNVYLESGAETVVFVDGRRVLARESARKSKATGVLRVKIQAESGYHSVLVKFMAQAAPFRVAILPPNSGSRRKNNTPYLKASPGSEDMLAKLETAH
jgi:hypothetical protein